MSSQVRQVCRSFIPPSLRAEDYSGASPVQTPGPHYLQFYLDALAANGMRADVYFL